MMNDDGHFSTHHVWVFVSFLPFPHEAAGASLAGASLAGASLAGASRAHWGQGLLGMWLSASQLNHCIMPS